MEALKSIDLGKNVRRGLKITWVGEASKLSPWFNEVLRMLGSYCLCDISVFSWFKNDSGVVILGAQQLSCRLQKSCKQQAIPCKNMLLSCKSYIVVHRQYILES